MMMKQKYNIALRPQTQQAAIIAVADCLSSIADEYRLGSQSLPHVTLCQFYAEEGEIESIWNNVCRALTVKSLVLAFNQFSFITFDNVVFWVSLLPDSCPQVYTLQNQVTKVFNQATLGTFDPHMTLINSRNAQYKEIGSGLLKGYSPIEDNFQLTLGLSDEIGQYKSDIYCF